MQTVELGVWEINYNESENAIRLFVNCWDRDAVIFRLDKTNIVSFMEVLDRADTEQVSLTGQPMKPIESVLVEEGEWGEDDIYECNYELRTEDITKFYDGELHDYIVKFAEPFDRRVLSSVLWDYWALDHLLAEAVQ